jgi:hypothetical protein
MIWLTRKFLASAAACGLTASVLVYVESYFGMTMDGIARWATGLHVGIFALLLPMYAVEYSAVNGRTFFWKEYARGMPKWIVPGVKALGLFFAIHFILFLVQSHAAAPEIKNGQFVLNNHGKIVKISYEVGIRRTERRRTKTVRDLMDRLLRDVCSLLVVPQTTTVN